MSNEILRKYIDIINEHETLNEEILEEGMLQKLAGLALGGILALGPKVADAGTVYSYLPSNGVTMAVAFDQQSIPADARVVLAVDTDTNAVSILKGGAKGQQVQPDPAAVKQGQQIQAQAAARPQAQQPQVQQPQAQQAQTQQPQGQSFSFTIKGLSWGMSPDEVDAKTGGSKGSLPSNFTIGMESGWKAEYQDGKLSSIYTYSPAAGAMELINDKFGNPTTRMNYTKSYGPSAEGQTHILIWEKPNVKITMYFPYKDQMGRWQGLSMTKFESPESAAKQSEKYKQRSAQVKGDFE